MKKKILGMLAVFMITMAALAPACFAADWVWVYSDDQHSCYFDRSTGKVINDSIWTWQKYTNTDGSYSIIKCAVSKDHGLYVFDIALYAADGTLMKHAHCKTASRIDIIPGSNGDKLYQVLSSYYPFP